MAKFIRLFFIATATVILSGISVAGLGIAVARAMLPPSGCTVTQARVEALNLEKMSYVDVVAALGCEGVLRQRQDYGRDLQIEDFSWRGEAWPYARFDGHFINRRLHGTQMYWLNLSLKG